MRFNSSLYVGAYNSITSIFSGYTFRKKLEHQEDGDAHVIQFRDVEDFVRINPESPVRIVGEKIPQKHFLRPYDILFLAKSQYNYTIPFQNEFPRAVASSMFLILRIKEKEVHPGYLAWYLNQKPAQNFLKKRTAGTYIKNIAKKDLEEVVIPIPSFDKQRKIEEIYRLKNKEINLIKDIADKKQQVLQQQLLKSIKED